MKDKQMLDVAAQLTAALITAGHVPPALHQKVDSAASHAGDLFRSVYKDLTGADLEM